MNKELFVSSTPHETKVGLVEDDLLAEVYLERENEYTLAGSIYKGRVTRVLPGMQSAFVDIGLERDAFLYVSDFMELEEHDDDLTDVVPANRGVPDLRQQPAGQTLTAAIGATGDSRRVRNRSAAGIGRRSRSRPKAQSEAQPATSAGAVSEPAWRFAEPRPRKLAWTPPSPWRPSGRPRRWPDRGSNGLGSRAGPNAQIGLPTGFQIAVLSRASRVLPRHPPAHRIPAEASPLARLPATSRSCCRESRFRSTSAARSSRPRSNQLARAGDCSRRISAAESVAPLAATFPEDEPIFAGGQRAVAEPLHEQHEDTRAIHEEQRAVESASTSTDWNREFRRPEEASVPASRLAWRSVRRTS